ncbi:hypothetical protein TI39_contig802g00003 [Zymoseptoria brevis]|uniref:Uncharacterized protein n=1 Tax=Zymoseptoria brevis TaxID=1047168 RepID=A0A0F4GFG0_9PEZI|nr:hypothetical protein TI39_contig802g00003 [Zymoseptoria brevis]
MLNSVQVANGIGGVVGKKRTADESTNLSNDQERFAKRFNLLNLGSERNAPSSYYIPVSRPTSPAPASLKQTTTTSNDDSMHIDDTRDRVYVRDLDEELADVESDEEKGLIFLPDIEEYFSKIPQQVLNRRRDSEHEGQELVLYSEPKSLTVDEGHDSVRKAILEARQRAREKAVEDARQQDMNARYDQSDHDELGETAHGYAAGYEVEQEPNPDAMEVD